MDTDKTEREIKEDFTMTLPVLYVMAGALVCFFVFLAIISPTLKDRLFSAGAIVFILVFTRICLRGGLQDELTSENGWRATDAGLKRFYSTGDAEVIRWEQIQHMRWVRLNGLIVRWDEPKTEHQRRCIYFKQEFKWDQLYRQYRAKLRVHQEEALKLIAIVESKTGLTRKKLAA